MQSGHKIQSLVRREKEIRLNKARFFAAFRVSQLLI